MDKLQDFLRRRKEWQMILIIIGAMLLISLLFALASYTCDYGMELSSTTIFIVSLAVLCVFSYKMLCKSKRVDSFYRKNQRVILFSFIPIMIGTALFFFKLETPNIYSFMIYITRSIAILLIITSIYMIYCWIK